MPRGSWTCGKRLSPSTIRRRFLRSVVRCDPLEAQRLAAVDQFHGDGSEQAEFALLVDDAYQHVGLGRLMLGHLVREAVQRRLRVLEGHWRTTSVSASRCVLYRAAPFPPGRQARIVKASAELAERTELGERLSTPVRSSGVSEDGADASFAGQYGGHLGLRSARACSECVRKCWSITGLKRYGASSTPKQARRSCLSHAEMQGARPTGCRDSGGRGLPVGRGVGNRRENPVAA